MTLRPNDPRMLKRDLTDLVENVRVALKDLVDGLRERADTIEANSVRLTVVQTITDLPANAGPRQFFRVATGLPADRTALFVGNGQAQPLTRITTAPL